MVNRLRLNKGKRLLCQLGSGVILFNSLSISAQQTTTDLKSISAQSPLESLLPMLLGLLSILAVIFGLAFILKRFTHLNPAAGNIKILETQRLGAKERLVIVEIQQQQLLLGVTPQNITQLVELKNPIEAKKRFTSFESLMKQMLNPAELVNAKGRTNNTAINEKNQEVNLNNALKKSHSESPLEQKSHGNFEDS